MENFLDKAQHLLIDIVILVVIFKFLRFVIKSIFKKIANRVRDTEIQKRIKTVRVVTSSIVDVFVVSVGLIHILYKLGLDVRPLLATAGVLGVAIGFGSKRMVEDIITGISLLLDGQVHVGDIVKINNISGKVEKINIRNVILRDTEGAKHFIRNAMVDVVTNYTRDYAYAVFEIQVSYKENIARVIDIIKQLGLEFKNSCEFNCLVLDELEMLGLDKFTQGAVIIKFRIKTLPSKQWEIQRAFNLIIKERFDREGILPPQITQGATI